MPDVWLRVRTDARGDHGWPVAQSLPRLLPAPAEGHRDMSRFTLYDIDDALPEQRLAAAVIRQALLDANAGSRPVHQWLRDDASTWLTLITPPSVDVVAVHARLLAHVDRPL
jgi:uncharacterized membrane protein